MAVQLLESYTTTFIMLQLLIQCTTSDIVYVLKNRIIQQIIDVIQAVQISLGTERTWAP